MSETIPPVYRLDGLHAVVTGAAQGLGLSMARHLAQLGTSALRCAGVGEDLLVQGGHLVGSDNDGIGFQRRD